MRLSLCQTVCFAWLLVVTASLAATSQSGDGASLFTQGKAFQSAGKTNEALWAYRQAVKTGSVEAACALGEILFRQGEARHNRQQVLQLAEGLHCLFTAATNCQPQACALLAESLDHGIGVESNRVSAYAWLLIAVESDGTYQARLDQLVVQLDPGEIVKAQKLAEDYRSGHWPTKLVRQVDQGDPRLVVQGISSGKHGTLVILNGDTLSAGESVDVTPAAGSDHKSDERLLVSCRKIGSDYMLVAVSGEPNLKLLSLEAH